MPLNVHTHNTAFIGISSMITAVNYGSDVVGASMDAISSLTSQQSLWDIAVVFCGTNIDAKFGPDSLGDIIVYWESVRSLCDPFKSGNILGNLRTCKLTRF